MAKLRFKLGAAALLLALCTTPVLAQSAGDSLFDPAPTDSWDRDVFVFGGPFHSGYFTQSFTLWNASWEPNLFVGGGYQQFFTRWGWMRLGAEGGVGLRFNTNGDTSFATPGGGTGSYPPLSGEVWAGAVARFDGVDIGPVHVTPALTAGVSAVTGLIGAEAEREAAHPFDRLGTGGRFLFYLGPELDFSLASNPNVEVFWRAQHRSGGFSTLMDLDGSNADTVGVRFKF